MESSFESLKFLGPTDLPSPVLSTVTEPKVIYIASPNSSFTSPSVIPGKQSSCFYGWYNQRGQWQSLQSSKWYSWSSVLFPTTQRNPVARQKQIYIFAQPETFVYHFSLVPIQCSVCGASPFKTVVLLPLLSLSSLSSFWMTHLFFLQSFAWYVSKISPQINTAASLVQLANIHTGVTSANRGVYWKILLILYCNFKKWWEIGFKNYGKCCIMKNCLVLFPVCRKCTRWLSIIFHIGKRNIKYLET